MTDYATPEGTKRYATRALHLPESAYRRLGRTEWMTSSVGFGTYRVDLGIPQHEEALEKALLSGCNLIDTSTNYGDGGSEQCVGRVLDKLFSHHLLKREEVIVISKVGYVQGENMALAQQREKEGRPFPDMVKVSEHCWHCIHPKFIEEQITSSLERLKLKRIDAYLLHNPEYFLSHAGQKKPTPSAPELRAIFYDRIRHAFLQLEEEVSKGRISYYGVSSNTFVSPVHTMEATSLIQMWKIAAQISKEKTGSPDKHHFCLIQCPGNLFESGAFLEKNNGCDDEASVVQFANEKQLGVLINRPLNAFVGNQLVRLAEFEAPKDPGDLGKVLHALVLLEQRFTDSLHDQLDLKPGDIPTHNLFRWGQELSSPDLRQLSLDQWLQIEGQMIQPQLLAQTHFLDQNVGEKAKPDWLAWKQTYLAAMTAVLKAFRSECALQSQKTSGMVAKKLNSFLPESLKSEPLSRKSLAVLINTQGVNCVLVGMRSPVYVEDVLAAAKFPKFSVSEKVYEAFRMG